MWADAVDAVEQRQQPAARRPRRRRRRIASRRRRIASSGWPRCWWCSLHAPSMSAVSSPSASGCAWRTRSSQDGASSGPVSVISPIRSSTTHAGSVSTNAAPNSCSHRRTALTATSAPLGHAHRAGDARRGGSARPVRRRPIAMACVSAPSTSRAVLERAARPLVRRPQPRASQRREPGPQEGAEQVVVAVPARLLVERHHEQVGGEQAVEQGGRLVDARDVHAQARRRRRRAPTSGRGSRRARAAGWPAPRSAGSRRRRDRCWRRRPGSRRVRRPAAARSPPAARRPASPR